MTDVFKAIADPTRREILLSLAKNPENVNTISEKFNMSRPAVSKHIKILSDNKLVRIETDKSDNRQRNCYVQLEALSEVNVFIKQLQQFWESKLDGLGNYLNTIE
ncbi:metalloregulator ArsR/SmtB family transcription factor [uncultured Aquimarina sp.]|uniref:ArsR/SmtB family transcription factor n=1 Tax=uncultured Aquimarina sp. TaxID=575652 RepID=UPI00260A9F5D|nr:metalloregulator ArsR/SmtB family transcription factor [uncultured Aquimarina sp.]